MNSVRKFVAATTIVTAAISLGGCASVGVDVASPQGVGVCDTDAVTLTVTQNSGGDTISIEYDGPEDVSLIAYQGLYSDNKFFDMSPTESTVFNYPVSQIDTDYAFNALDFESSPWVTSGSGSSFHAEYNGSVDDFVADFDYAVVDSDPTSRLFDKILPLTVGVLCDAGFTSQVVSDPLLDFDSVMDGFDVAVAQPIFPNFMYIDAPTISDQADIDRGISGKMTFPAELADAWPTGVDVELLIGSMIFLGERDPMLPATNDHPWSLTDATLGDVWFLTLMSAMNTEISTTFGFTGDYSLSEPIDFEFTGETSAPGDGYYLLFLGVGDLETDPENFKVVTAVAHYTADRGMTLKAVDENPTAERLAPTGGDPNAFIWAIIGGLVVLAAVVLRPKRRAQDGSTNDPSDTNE